MTGGTGEAPPALREIPDPPGIEQARTLPATWYADDAFFRLELHRVFRSGWVCAGITDELPAPKHWKAITVGGLPLLMVVDAEGTLRAFLNVCRHRASPLCEQDAEGAGSLIRCPYHAWLYRLDGSLAKASGLGQPERFDPDDHALTPVAVAVWRRTVWVNAGDPRAVLDLGRLADAVRDFPIESMRLVLSESSGRAFNWKVLLENYSENYHTPFVHPEIDTSSTEDYPMVSEGPVLYAWDRRREPSAARDDQIRATRLPGEPGWDELARARSRGPYGAGHYLTIWPNAMINVFPDAALIMWIEPLTAAMSRVERRLLAAHHLGAADVDAIVAAHALVHRQDVDICERVQRSHTAGLDARGVLATVEERGVFFVHEHLRRCLAGDLAVDGGVG